MKTDKPVLLPKYKIGEVVVTTQNRVVNNRNVRVTALVGTRWLVAGFNSVPTRTGFKYVYDLVAEQYAGATIQSDENGLRYAPQEQEK